MRKNKKKYIGMILLFLVGLSILLYPTVSNLWNTYRNNLLISDYSSMVSSGSDSEELDNMWKAAEEYNKQIKQESVPDAFSIRDGQTDPVYESLLNLNGDGMMGYVEVPVIGQSIPIYHYTTEESLEKGAGHLFGSSLPVGGESTHCIISAHRGLPSAKLFTDLDRLQKGDIFLLHIYDQVFTYEVDQIHIVEPIDYGLLNIEEGEDLCTLLTCTPYGINTERLLVRGHRIANRSGDNSRITSDAAKVSTVLVAVGIGIPLLIISFIAVDVSERVPKRKKKSKNKLLFIYRWKFK